MSRVILISLFLAFAASLTFARGDHEFVPAPPSEYERFFRSLTPEEQAHEFVSRFTEYYPQASPSDFEIAGEILDSETGLEAMPYLRREFDRLEFEFCPGQSWSSLCDEAPAHLLRLIASMVWFSGFPQNEGEILRPSDEDIEWFVNEAEAKIRRYIQTYRRIDPSMLRAESAILDMTDRELALTYWDNEPARFVYDKYVRGDPELETTVALPEYLVFQGFDGPVLDAEPQPPAAP